MQQFYSATVYFMDPSKICSEGRTKEDFEENGTANGIWFQTASTSADILNIDVADVTAVSFFSLNYYFLYSSMLVLEKSRFLTAPSQRSCWSSS